MIIKLGWHDRQSWDSTGKREYARALRKLAAKIQRAPSEAVYGSHLLDSKGRLIGSVEA